VDRSVRVTGSVGGGKFSYLNLPAGPALPGTV